MTLGTYECQTTFWQDFTIAECFGLEAIRDTYRRASAEWGNNVKYMTELTMVLNWKLWDHYGKGREEYARIYDGLWKAADRYCAAHFTGDDLTYYYRTTD